MKQLYFIFLLALMTACATNQSIIEIPANQKVEIDYSDYELYRAKLKNKTMKGIDVAVVSKATNEQIKGFGLGVKSDAEIVVEKDNKLILKNSNDKSVKVAVSVTKEKVSTFTRKGEYVSFTLQNKSAKSIPLLIPSVMNPNLSPFSKSGVDLKVGQEILFKARGKKYILLTIDDTITNGDIVEVSALLKERKSELGL